jgi:hypothetical protein
MSSIAADTCNSHATAAQSEILQSPPSEQPDTHCATMAMAGAMSVSFEHVGYDVPSPSQPLSSRLVEFIRSARTAEADVELGLPIVSSKSPKQILKNVCGRVEPGESLAILGCMPCLVFCNICTAAVSN